VATVSAIVATYLGGPPLLACLEALAGQTRRPDAVHLVVSNPADPTGELPRRWPYPLHIHRLDRRAHYGRAINAGAARAPAGDLLVLNDDTRAQPGFVEALLAAREAHGAGLYQPRILLRADSTRLDNAGHGLFPDGFNWARGREAPDGRGWDAAGTVGAVSGAAFLLTRCAAERLGGFDESFEAYGEDVDLSLRAARLGLPMRYVPGARIEHELGASYGRYGARKLFLIERNRVRAGVRSLPLSALAAMPAWTALRWATFAAAGVAGRGWGARVGPAAQAAAVAGALAGVAWVPDAWRKRRADARGWALGEREMWAHLLRERARLRDILGPESPRRGSGDP
jgi:GT2 family glycosyltransferase